MFPSGVVKPVSAAELRFAIAIFENAALMKTPRANIEARRFSVVEDDGSATTYRLGDTQFMRGLTAVLDHYKEQRSPEADRHAVAWRILCIPNLVKDPACANWIQETDTKLEFHDAVIDTLATFPMTYGEEFSVEEFFRDVQRAASRKAA